MDSYSKEDLKKSVQYLKSVGPKRAEAFKKIGIETVEDLLFYFPSRHLDRTTTLDSMKAYQYVMNGYDGEITIIGKIVDKEKRRFGRKEIMTVQLSDAKGMFECIWFQGAKYFYTIFNDGDHFAVSGKPTISKYGKFQFAHPDFDKISEDESNSFLNTGKIIPFYRIPGELKSEKIGDFSLRRIISNAVNDYADFIEETLTQDIINKHSLPGITDAVKNFHFPENKEKLNDSLKRFKFEELFFLELLIAIKKHNYKNLRHGNSLKPITSLVANFVKALPFQLTKAQLKVLSEIRKDMEDNQPMNRLLQGDVGSGKTIVALISMLIAVDNGYQAALMAPTEILADQHAKNISKLLSKLKVSSLEQEVKVSLLIGGQRKSVKEKNLQNIELQEADIIVGTHALFEENVKFKNLGLVIVDEQHRFGVAQRAKLQSKGKAPDVIVMSATPIPRTLSMTLYGDLDVSTIDELPKNRKKIKTVLRREKNLPDIYKFILDKKKEGCQSFIVYPLVEESDKLELKAAETYFEKLQDFFGQNLEIGLIHGKMSWLQKEETMQLFQRKLFDVLVATTVIEIGIDIPDANIILINDAHRFGLSQLHQLRGRIGRSDKQAYCILVTKDEFLSFNNKLELDYLSLSQLEKYKAAVRLQSMVKYNDGFKIAEIDMKLRGPGDIFSTKQSGFPDLKYVDMTKDIQLVMEAKETAFKIINDDPKLSHLNNHVIKLSLEKKFLHHMRFADIA
jgi:ATP-dependent DNA helicase RecG